MKKRRVCNTSKTGALNGGNCLPRVWSVGVWLFKFKTPLNTQLAVPRGPNYGALDAVLTTTNTHSTKLKNCTAFYAAESDIRSLCTDRCLAIPPEHDILKSSDAAIGLSLARVHANRAPSNSAEKEVLAGEQQEGEGLKAPNKKRPF